jgi:hypothetical protein
MLADDWGLVEPYSLGTMGNINALHNDFHQCIEGVAAFASRPMDEFPFAAGKIAYCPLQEDRSSYGYLLTYHALKPGNFVVNVIYGLLMPGVLKGQKLIGNMKIMQVRFRQAQLAVRILSRNIPASEIDGFVKGVDANLQNPITNEPFEWDKENQALAFERPLGKRKAEFKLTINE